MANGRYIMVDEEILQNILEEISQLRTLMQIKDKAKHRVSDDVLLDTADLIGYLKMDRRTIYAYRITKGLPFKRKDNGRIFYWKSEIDEYFGKNK